MEHRGDGHVDVSIVQPPVSYSRQGGAGRQRVQHELPVTEVDALRLPGRSGRVECGGTGAFIQIREIMPWIDADKQRLVLGLERKRGLRRPYCVVQKDEFFPSVDPIPDLL